MFQKRNTTVIAERKMLISHRMNSLALQLTRDIGGNSELNAQLVKDIKERADMISNAVDSSSALFKQLAADQEICGSLKMGLESVAPKLGDLTASIGKLDQKEVGLVQQLGEMAKCLSEVRMPEKAPLESEAEDQLAKDQLQLQLDEVSAQLSMAEANLAAKEEENESTRRSLSDATAQAQVAEERTSQLESEVAALQDNVKAVEFKVREELSRASVVSRDHIRAKFEQQLHNAQWEKMESEKEVARIKEQLVCAQQSLVSFASFSFSGC